MSPTAQILSTPRTRVDPEALARMLGGYAASASARNATLEAIADEFPGDAEPLVAELPFASRRRSGAQQYADRTVVLGAPELFALGELRDVAAAQRGRGRRVLAYGEAAVDLRGAGPDVRFDDVEPLRLVVLAERLRADAAETVAFFRRQGVELKIFSGDAPRHRGRDRAGRRNPRRARAARQRHPVADLVLVEGSFAAVPSLIADGRQALRNLQRVAKLYVSKSSFAAFLILAIGITDTAYPLLPRHFSLAATLTIGIRTLILALAPSSGDWHPVHFARRTAQFAIPTGLIAGVGVVASYLFALHALDFTDAVSRTIAATVLVAVGLYLVLVLEASGRRRSRIVSIGCAVLAAAYALTLATPATREFFDLAAPAPGMLAVAAGGAGLSVTALLLAGFTPGVAAGAAPIASTPSGRGGAQPARSTIR